MTATKKLILIAFLYLVASMALSVVYQDYKDGSWLRSHVRWTYLVWSFFGPVSALEYGWQGLIPVWKHFWTFLAGGSAIVPLLSMPVLFRGGVSSRLCGLGLILWLVLAAWLVGPSELGTQIDRLIVAAGDLT